MPCKSSTGEKEPKPNPNNSWKDNARKNRGWKNPQNKHHLYKVIKLRHKQCTNANGQIFPCTSPQGKKVRKTH